ncbi:hypothetical protein GCM10010123_36750 [Pilimelia anulata]|uniref:Uncharacterized protein n=1 Tax=Pilimelia anulata TaxID=53371 RepID=A0A8J3B989_9ACTN|nr:hypothetical protein [Pilimelia anulata]GGK03501.1 hypothetical protein GCM10010123_36750 [Pilimelia anulata]
MPSPLYVQAVRHVLLPPRDARPDDRAEPVDAVLAAAGPAALAGIDVLMTSRWAPGAAPGGAFVPYPHHRPAHRPFDVVDFGGASPAAACAALIDYLSTPDGPGTGALLAVELARTAGRAPGPARSTGGVLRLGPEYVGRGPRILGCAVLDRCTAGAWPRVQRLAADWLRAGGLADRTPTVVVRRDSRVRRAWSARAGDGLPARLRFPPLARTCMGLFPWLAAWRPGTGPELFLDDDVESATALAVLAGGPRR